MIKHIKAAKTLRLVQVTNRCSRIKGLLGRSRALRKRVGLWLIPCRMIHTIGMQFALDIAFIDRYGGVVKLIRHLPPGRLAYCLHAYSTIEFHAGTLDLTSESLIQIEQAVAFYTQKKYRERPSG